MSIPTAHLVRAMNRSSNFAHTSPSVKSSHQSPASTKYGTTSSKKYPRKYVSNPTAEGCVKGKGEISPFCGRSSYVSRSHVVTNNVSYASSPKKNRTRPPSGNATGRRAVTKSLDRFSIHELLVAFRSTVSKRNASPLTRSKHSSFVETHEAWFNNSPYKSLKETDLELLLKRKEREFIEGVSTRIEDLERIYKMSPTKRNAELLAKARELQKSQQKKRSKSKPPAATQKMKKPWTDESVTEFVATRFRMKDTEEDTRPTDRDEKSPMKSSKLDDYLKDPANGKIVSKLVVIEKTDQPKGDFAYWMQAPTL